MASSSALPSGSSAFANPSSLRGRPAGQQLSAIYTKWRRVQDNMVPPKASQGTFFPGGGDPELEPDMSSQITRGLLNPMTRLETPSVYTQIQSIFKDKQAICGGAESFRCIAAGMKPSVIITRNTTFDELPVVVSSMTGSNGTTQQVASTFLYVSLITQVGSFMPLDDVIEITGLRMITGANVQAPQPVHRRTGQSAYPGRQTSNQSTTPSQGMLPTSSQSTVPSQGQQY